MIQLDLNNPEFQANLLALDKPDAWAVLKTLGLLQAMIWDQLQSSRREEVAPQAFAASQVARSAGP